MRPTSWAIALSVGLSVCQSLSLDNTTEPPPPLPNEAVADYIDQIFDDDIISLNSTSLNGPIGTFNLTGSSLQGLRKPVGSSTTQAGNFETSKKLAKRDSVGTITWLNGIRTLSWDDGGSNYYNLSADLSSCSSGIRLHATAGIYTSTSGKTSTNASFNDIVTDLWSVRHVRHGIDVNPFPQYTLVNANALLDEAQAFLDLMVKPNASDAAGTDGTSHDELRKLLGGSGPEYYAGTLLYMAAAGAIGAGLAAFSDHVFPPHEVQGRNMFQTGVTGALFGLARGVIMRQVDNGHFHGVNTVANAVQGAGHDAANTVLEAGQAAVVENAFIAWARARIAYLKAQLEKLKEQNSDADTEVAADLQALELAAMEEGLGSGTSGSSNGGASSSNNGGASSSSSGSGNDGSSSTIPNDYTLSPEDAQNSMYQMSDLLYQEQQIQHVLAGQQFEEFNAPQMEYNGVQAALNLDGANAGCG